MHEIYRIGNAQSIGSYQIQSNYFSTKLISTEYGNCVLAALADGTIDHMNGRRCAVLAVEACMREFINMPPDMDLTGFIDFVIGKILHEMRDIIFLGKTPYLSFSLQFVRQKELFYFNVGRNKIFLFDGMDYQILNEKSGRAELKKGMTVGNISNGVQEALKEKNMISYLRKKEHPYEKAQEIISGVKEKNIKMAGNATVVLIEDCL